MTAPSPSHGPAALVGLLLTALLAGCTGASAPASPPTRPTPSRPSTDGTSGPPPSPTSRPVPRPPLPSSPVPSSLPASPPAQLAPVSGSPDDLGRIDIRAGSPRRKRVLVRLPAGSGYTVTAGCIGAPGTLLRYSVIGTSEPDSGFLFGSTTPCNGRFVTDAALANIKAPTPAQLEVTVDAGVEAATVVLRPAPTDAHL